MYRVMLIDDSEADLFLSTLVLKDTGRVSEVLTFQWAEKALAFLGTPQSTSIDVLLLDINMPRMDGFAFLDAYSELPEDRRASLTVVMLSTSLREEDRRRAERTGLVSGYNGKPLTHADAEAILDRLPAIKDSVQV